MKIQKFFSFRGQAPWPPYIKSLILKRWKTWHFLHQVLCPPIDICSHWQGLFMIEGVFLYWPVFKLPRIAGIERGIFVTCDKWRYDTLKIMEMRAIFTQKMVFQVYNRFQELKQSRNSLELFMARISTILLCIFMYHIWKKNPLSVPAICNKPTNRMSIFKEMRPWGLVEHRSIQSYKKTKCYCSANLNIPKFFSFKGKTLDPL